MEEPLEQEHTVTNDDLKPSSSTTTTTTTTTKSSRSAKQTTSTNGTTRRHKRRRQTNSTRSSSVHSTSSSRSSSSSSIHSSHSSIKHLNSNEQETQKTRSALAQEQLETIINKTKTGKYDILDSFAFLSFEIDEDWRIAFEHFSQQQLQRSYTAKKSYSLSGKKNGNVNDHTDGHSLHRSISLSCKPEDTHRISSIPISASVDDSSTDNHRSSMWQNHSPSKTSNDRQLTTVKNEPTDPTNRTTSEHEDNHFDIEHNQNSLTSSSSQISKDDSKIESAEKKHHHHHHHKSHKRHKTKHDLSANCDSSSKHATITSMSDLAKKHIKHEPIQLPPPLNFSGPFDPKLFPMPSFSPFASPHPPPPSSPFPGPYDPSLMLASRLYGGQYPRDLLMPPPPRPPSRSLQHPFSLKENQPDAPTSMEKMLEKLYPGVLPSYLAAAASAAAAASRSSNSPVSSLNVKMHGASPNGPDHPLWSHHDALQRQFLSASNKPTSTKSPLFEGNTKLPSNHSGPSPTDHHHHHHRRHSSSASNPDVPNSTTPSTHPLYLAPVIVTEFHQHQHNHNHTHEHKLNITTKDERQSSPRSKTPVSNENKKNKSGFSVTDMFIDKTSPVIKHSPQSQSQPQPQQQQQQQQQSQQQGFLSVVNNKKDTNNQSPLVSLKKPSNGKWSTAHVQIAWMIFNNEQRQRDKLNLLNPANKVRPSATMIPPSPQSTLLPPPLPLLDNNNDLSLLRPPPAPFPFPFPFDMNSQQNPLFRSASTTKLPQSTVTPPSSSASLKTQNIKREQKPSFMDERGRRTSPSPLSRPTSGSNFLPSPSHRMKMDFPSLLLPPPQQHQLPTFPMNDDRKRFMAPGADLMSPFGPQPSPSPFLSTFFPMGAPSMPPPMPSSSSSRRTGINSDSSKSLFPGPPPPSAGTPFDFTRSPLLPSGLPLPNNHFESERYRFLLEHQARERDFQYAMMAAAASGNGPPPPPPLFPDSNSSALFKHY